MITILGKAPAALLLTLVGIMAASSTNATVLIIGAPGDANSGNCYPFGCSGGSEYQQVYASSNFTGLITINDIEFYMNNSPGGNLNSGTYTFSLSTTTVAVDNLDTTNFANNVGSDNALFGTYTLGGAAPSLLVFNGTSFTYNPANGNLLLDIQANITQEGGSFYDARNGDASGLFSRAHDFGSGFAGYGLVTGFSTTIPEPTTLALLGLGLAGMTFSKRCKLS